MSRRDRLDIALVARGLFESRAKAQEAIAAGLVSVDGVVIRKASEPVADAAALHAKALYPWVSRGGVKLAAALDHFGFDPGGCVCLDIGASTGGFTDVLLARGAARVVAVDVGHGQLHPRLNADPRVLLLEGRDARSLVPADMPGPASLIAVDVSFIALRLVLPSVQALAAPQAELAALIKPQFEAGRAGAKKGIVRDFALHRAVCEAVASEARALGWSVMGIMDSPIRGGDGNREFLLGARRS